MLYYLGHVKFQALHYRTCLCERKIPEILHTPLSVRVWLQIKKYFVSELDRGRGLGGALKNSCGLPLAGHGFKPHGDIAIGPRKCMCPQPVSAKASCYRDALRGALSFLSETCQHVIGLTE